ncbi:MAG: DUF2225 domain-containing protein [Leptospiraceae bacterium]|nr:DUF2225 domain-containing protein [Leptospiraceae bacterium]
MPPKAISYRVKEGTTCPLCSFEYRREKLHSGGGRLIAGNLTKELRRLYQVSKKFGRVYPLAYEVSTCPNCLYSSYENDFNTLESGELQELKAKSADRRMQIEKILGPLDFNEDRNLVLGAASYLLAIDCYQKRGIDVAPTPKKAISAMRGAWLFGDLHDEFPGKGFDKVQSLLYMKAVGWYSPMLEIMSTGSEAHDKFIRLLGPDTDKNWGFDGVIYLNGYLSNKYLDQITTTEEQRIAILERNKQHLGKLYGAGRSSSSKPSVIINLAKDLYEDISKQLEELKGTAEAT